jgi:hypothetical protein
MCRLLHTYKESKTAQAHDVKDGVCCLSEKE